MHPVACSQVKARTLLERPASMEGCLYMCRPVGSTCCVGQAWGQWFWATRPSRRGMRTSWWQGDRRIWAWCVDLYTDNVALWNHWNQWWLPFIKEFTYLDNMEHSINSVILSSKSTKLEIPEIMSPWTCEKLAICKRLVCQNFYDSTEYLLAIFLEIN